MKLKSRKEFRKRRHTHLRKRVQGTAERPRMAVSVSSSNIYVQLIDDDAAVTLAMESTLPGKDKKNVESAMAIGEKIAAKAAEKGISSVVFDRGGHKFHGRVKAVVQGAVKAGLAVGSTVLESGAEPEKADEIAPEDKEVEDSK